MAGLNYNIKNKEIKLFSKLHDLFQTAAEDFAYRAIDLVNNKGVFNVALSGGNTPKVFFEILSQLQIPWDKIRFFFTDERYVPVDSSENNYHMADQYLFSKISIPRENIFRIPTEFKNPEEAAKEYELILRKAFCIKDIDNEFPQFDVVYLGLGDDGHTASLMPFNNLVLNKHQLVASIWVSKLKMYRITLTPSVINHSENIIFLVTGENKAPAVSAVLEGKFEPQRYPAQLINCIAGKTIWYLDKAAATLIKD